MSKSICVQLMSKKTRGRCNDPILATDLIALGRRVGCVFHFVGHRPLPLWLDSRLFIYIFVFLSFRLFIFIGSIDWLKSCRVDRWNGLASRVTTIVSWWAESVRHTIVAIVLEYIIDISILCLSVCLDIYVDTRRPLSIYLDILMKLPQEKTDWTERECEKESRCRWQWGGRSRVAVHLVDCNWMNS